VSDTIATMPIHAYVKTDNERIPSPDRPTWLDYPSADPWLGQIGTLSQVVTSLLLRGNAYILTPRSQGLVTGLLVLDPDKVIPPDQDSPTYRVLNMELGYSELMHLRGFMLPGSNQGVSLIKYARESLGHALAVQQYGASFFENGAYPGLIIESPAKLSPVGQAAAKEAWNDTHRGSSNAHKVAILTEGAQMKTLTVSPEDSQFIQTAQFKVSDVARLFGVPPHLIGDSSNSTSWGSGLAEQNSAFKQFGLGPWVIRIEVGYTTLWRSEGADPRQFVKLDTDAVLKGTTKERYQAHQIALQAGFKTVNEVRRDEDLPPLAEGDTYRRKRKCLKSVAPSSESSSGARARTP
jgi:HK97 family phage portal protein